MNKKKILVKGPAMSLSGYGEQCRFALRALRAFPDVYDIYLINIPWGQTGFITDNTEERQWIDETLKRTIEYAQSGGHFDMSLQVTIPNEWEPMAPVNVGYTAGIETSKIDSSWIEKADLMDRIIVISNHSKDTFNNFITQASSLGLEEVGFYATGEPFMVKDIDWFTNITKKTGIKRVYVTLPYTTYNNTENAC